MASIYNALKEKKFDILEKNTHYILYIREKYRLRGGKWKKKRYKMASGFFAGAP